MSSSIYAFSEIQWILCVTTKMEKKKIFQRINLIQFNTNYNLKLGN